MAEEIATVAPAVMAVEFRIQSALAVPTDPSTIRVPPEVVNVHHVAVPVASAEASSAIAFAVRTPAAAAPKAVAESASSASFTCAPRAVATFVGCVPS